MATSIVGANEPELQNLIKSSRILLVGCGGIGCEVLKNLVLMGFSELDIIDLDTIEVSNLNRQFLFHKEFVGKPKSHVAKDSVLVFNPNVNINSHYDDITDQKFGIAFFNKFKLVVNALDNRAARIHVNRMCLSCNIPLIESGTTGYSGQVELIFKGKTMCYECVPKITPKTFPMCTIRNTPKEPIHCIAWAKFLFGELFGEHDEIVTLDHTLNSDQPSSSTQEYTKISSTREWAVENDYEREKLMKKIFFDDIHFMLYKMPHLYQGKTIKPVPLDQKLLEDHWKEYKNVPDVEVLDLQQNFSMFLDSIDSIKKKFKNSEMPLVWDKDEDDFMNFVVSCSNIRAAIFNIPLLSHFDIKSKAGNIIPAIATANAIIGGQIVMHVLRMLKGKAESCQSVFLRALPNHKGGMLVKDRHLQKPVANCNVCSTNGKMVLVTDVNKMTVRQFQDLVLKQKLNVILPDVMVDGRVMLSSDETDNMDDFSQYTLFCMKFKTGSIIEVDDFFQSYSIKLELIHKDQENEEDPLFEVFASKYDYLKESNGANAQEADNDDCLIEDKEINIKELKIMDTVFEKIIAPKRKNDEDGDETTEHKKICVDVTLEDEEVLAPKRKNGDETTEHEIISVDATVEDEEVLAPKRKNEEDGDETIEHEKISVDATVEDEVLAPKRKNEEDGDETTEHKTICVDITAEDEEVFAPKRKADDDEDHSESKKSRVDE